MWKNLERYNYPSGSLEALEAFVRNRQHSAWKVAGTPPRRAENGSDDVRNHLAGDLITPSASRRLR
jgi:hypothetical protein